MVLVALIGDDLPLPVQLRWVKHLARVRNLDVLLLQRIEAAQARAVDIDLATVPKQDENEATAALRQAVADVPDFASGPAASTDAGKEEPATTGTLSPSVPGTSSPESDVPAISQPFHVAARALYFDTHATLRNLVIEEVNRVKAPLLSITRAQLLGAHAHEFTLQRALLFEYVPCETIVCQGLTEDTDLRRIAVLRREGINRQSALRLATDLARAGDGLTALHVNPDIGVDSRNVGERRLSRFLATYPAVEATQPAHRIIVDDSLTHGIQEFWTEGNHDLLVIPATAGTPEAEVGLKFGKNIPVVISLAATPITSRTRAFIKEGLRQNVPQIARDDRVALVDRVQSNAEWNFDFVALMILSASIAAFGLIQNSAAVVIGAMLVAPLMTPLIGLGLALVQGNTVLAAMSARSVVRGIVVAFCSGFVMGLVVPDFDEPTREILSRGGPGTIDLAVAFLSGIAAAYAQSRPNLFAALPGVAIAAALVPPIAASGLALSLGEVYLALGAFLLFVINMVAIILASMLALYAVGIRHTHGEAWAVRASSALILAFFALFLYLAIDQRQVEVAEAIPGGIEEAIKGVLGPDYQLIDIAVGYDELGYQLNVDVRGPKPVSPELANAVRERASEFYDRAVRIRLVARVSAENF